MVSAALPEQLYVCNRQLSVFVIQYHMISKNIFLQCSTAYASAFYFTEL